MLLFHVHLGLWGPVSSIKKESIWKINVLAGPSKQKHCWKKSVETIFDAEYHGESKSGVTIKKKNMFDHV